MALQSDDLVILQEQQSGNKKLMKCTAGNFFTNTAEIVGIDGGTKILSTDEYDYPDA